MGLRCFVAMALGREDTDTVYDGLIVPALREKGIAPVRVDRIEHNEDIDDRIISELGRCDLALADLTYARPSVYFEAGFAQRKVPVIYTCRRDHLSGKADDSYGNFRVHFDLQMKNIITWSSPSDRGFQERLSKRLRIVLRPLLRDMEAKEKLRSEVERFSALSVEDRILRVLNITVRRLRAAGYRGIWADEEALRGYFGIGIDVDSIPDWRRQWPGDLEYRLFDTAMSLQPGWVGTRRVPGAIHGALVHVSSGLTLRELRALWTGPLRDPLYSVNLAHATGPAGIIVERVFLCALRKVPRHRVQEALQDFRWDDESQSYARSDVLELPGPGALSRQARLFTRLGGYEFFVFNPKVQSPEHRKLRCRIRDDFVTCRGARALGRVQSVPRYVYVYVLDDIGSDKALDTRFSACVTATLRQSGEPEALSGGPAP